MIAFLRPAFLLSPLSSALAIVVTAAAPPSALERIFVMGLSKADWLHGWWLRAFRSGRSGAVVRVWKEVEMPTVVVQRFANERCDGQDGRTGCNEGEGRLGKMHPFPRHFSLRD